MNSKIQNSEIKLSIVMPVFQTEKYVDRCIDSVLKQTYKNIELIVVDDCSKGDIRERIKRYIKRDKRIRFISNKKNMGLFQTRLIGAAQATGHYLAFIDSDDYVTCDYYHVLLKSALEAEADIAVGHTVFQEADGSRFIRNFHDACFQFNKISGSEVQKRYFGQQGRCFSWHTIWNKIYKKELWDRCVPVYRALGGHVVMTEDIAFSSVLFYFADSVTVAHNEAYFYCANENASTNTTRVTFERFAKNVSDMKNVFDFVENFLKKEGADAEYQKDFHEWRRYYARMWRYMPDERLPVSMAKKGAGLIHDFCPDEKEKLKRADGFFDIARTVWNGGLESQKQSILETDDLYVSFDIFDTLIQRPFYDPEDLFDLLDKYAETLIDPNISFRKMRVGAEKFARHSYAKKHPEWEDITIDEIYVCMQELYRIPKSAANIMKEQERNLEICFCSVRKAGQELYETALLAGKKILLVSDMYLDQDTMEKILKKNGYEDYYELYLSSAVRKAKYTGNLFRYVKKQIGSDVGHIYHIGDNWQNDYVNAKKQGFSPLFFPKAAEVFENRIEGVDTGNCAFMAEKAAGASLNTDELHRSLGFRCMQAMVCNWYFDNPYRSFCGESDFNMDPCLIGYYAVGMHLTGIGTWILSESREHRTGMIHFLARDGFLLMQAYNILAGKVADAAGFDYLYASRKAVLSGMITSEQSFYQLPVEYRCHSPETLLEILCFASKEMTDAQKEELCSRYGWKYRKKFADEEEYLAFVRFFVEQLYSNETLESSKQAAEAYYSCISERDVTFDMGYSGRIQTAISRLAGKKIDAWFIHSDHVLSDKMQRIGGYRIHNFYDYVPTVSGVLREYLLSDYGAACTGFCMDNGCVRAQMEDVKRGCQDTFIIRTIQDAALDFVKDFCTIFDGFTEWIPFRPQEVSLPFEGFLCGAGYMDRKIFAASYFEDQVYGADENINIEEFMNQYIPFQKESGGRKQCVDWIVRMMQGRSKWAKAAAYFIVDRKFFKKTIAEKWKNHWRL